MSEKEKLGYKGRVKGLKSSLGEREGGAMVSGFGSTLAQKAKKNLLAKRPGMAEEGKKDKRKEWIAYSEKIRSVEKGSKDLAYSRRMSRKKRGSGRRSLYMKKIRAARFSFLGGEKN